MEMLTAEGAPQNDNLEVPSSGWDVSPGTGCFRKQLDEVKASDLREKMV